MRSLVALIAALAATLVGSSAFAQEPRTVLAAADPASATPLAGPQAIDEALPPAAPSAAESEQPAALDPPEPTLFAVIDLGSQTMTVSDESGPRYTWKISSARGGYRTPTGTYNVNWTSRMHYSKQYDGAPMPHAVFFHQGVAVHATNDIRNLGRPASHGCVRLAPKNARIFYNLVQEHGEKLTQITVRGQPPYSPVVAEPRRRYVKPQPSFQPFGGLFGYSQPSYQKKKKKQYGGSYNTW